MTTESTFLIAATILYLYVYHDILYILRLQYNTRPLLQ